MSKATSANITRCPSVYLDLEETICNVRHTTVLLARFLEDLLAPGRAVDKQEAEAGAFAVAQLERLTESLQRSYYAGFDDKGGSQERGES